MKSVKSTKAKNTTRIHLLHQVEQHPVNPPWPPLDRDFYTHPDVVQVARRLLGKILCTRIPGEGLSYGLIAETEAYGGMGDRACHAFAGRRTTRTETMYQEGGVAYVYLCYGLHALLNVVSNRAGVPEAVLIRALWPLYGLPLMQTRRGGPLGKAKHHFLLSGPGKLTQALGITCRHNGLSLLGPELWIADVGLYIPPRDIKAGPRVGVAYAGIDADRPWRFQLTQRPFPLPPHLSVPWP